MTNKVKPQPMCDLCDTHLTTCSMCKMSFKEGDGLYCYDDKHFCSAECCASYFASTGEVVMET